MPALLLLPIVLALLSPALQSALHGWLHRQPKAVFAAPVFLSASFCLAVRYYKAFSMPLVFLILAYTFVPVICAYAQGPGRGNPPTWTDFAVILILWLPVEFSAGQQWVPKHVQGMVHSLAYGIAILLALWVFLIFRSIQGMKYNLPWQARDLIYPFLAFVVIAPILIFVGLRSSFIAPFHVPRQLTVPTLVTRFFLILVATALPEEILFRALIQNFLMQKRGSSNRILFLSAFIFGCAHLNNGPGPLPNWRYMAIATIAGIAYGKVFQKTSTVFSPAILHATVNTAKHTFF